MGGLPGCVTSSFPWERTRFSGRVEQPLNKECIVTFLAFRGDRNSLNGNGREIEPRKRQPELTIRWTGCPINERRRIPAASPCFALYDERAASTQP